MMKKCILVFVQSTVILVRF